MLSFNELRFFIILVVTIDLIFIVHIVNFEKKLGKFDFFTFLLLFALIFFNLGTFGTMADWTVDFQSAQFVTSVESSISFAFIFSVISSFFVLWHYLNPNVKGLLTGGLLMSHLSILILIFSLVTGLISPSIIPSSIQDYVPTILALIVEVSFEFIKRKGSK